jgi:hypothetical protein
VTLTQNERQKEDTAYGSLLNRICMGCAKRKTIQDPISDIDILNRQIMQNLSKDNPVLLKEFKNAPIIIGHKSVCDAINAKKITLHAKCKK